MKQGDNVLVARDHQNYRRPARWYRVVAVADAGVYARELLGGHHLAHETKWIFNWQIAEVTQDAVL